MHNFTIWTYISFQFRSFGIFLRCEGSLFQLSENVMAFILYFLLSGLIIYFLFSGFIVFFLLSKMAQIFLFIYFHCSLVDWSHYVQFISFSELLGTDINFFLMNINPF